MPKMGTGGERRGPRGECFPAVRVARRAKDSPPGKANGLMTSMRRTAVRA